ncbi:uncharacterized protein MAM_06276 [Metarhizium album ARSEF 1941]|uniref:Apple domain-containing protein n=1 Tax=Metarhizium album (strain ARSEF 1941) TaxID=1081103 RepID=A0A0B2WQI6_METAS|nr:uncharacterized protein MAM_06276 [Metarhizium album ARSEF 1941]KHN95914.1 hypothetical protein MAM_06276 [Metarhizium album ARSEF 1941]
MSTRQDADGNGSRGPSNTKVSTCGSRGSDSSGEKGQQRPTDSAKSKAIAWAEDQLTFYREGTPPPLDDDGYRQSTGPRAAGAYSYDYSYDRVAPPAPIPQATICGLGKRLFYTIVAAAIVVAAMAVGVGVGVGLGVGRHHSTSDERGSSTKTPSAASIQTVTPTSIAAKPTQTPLMACPAANNTRYEVSSVKKTFLRVCGVDYTGSHGATDLGVVRTSSMQECMNSCAGYPTCTGCSWGVIPGDAGSDHRCWLKKDLETPTAVRSGWDFAILQ